MKNYKVSNTLIIVLSAIGVLVAFMLFNDPFQTSQSETNAILGMITFVLSLFIAIVNIKSIKSILPITKSNTFLFYGNGLMFLIYTLATLAFLFQGGNIKILKLILLPLVLAICFAITYLYQSKNRKASV